jgi:hypothetical protein
LCDATNQRGAHRQDLAGTDAGAPGAAEFQISSPVASCYTPAMRRCGRILLVLLFVLLAAAAVLIVRRNAEPACAGRSLTEWVQIYLTLDEGAPSAQAEQVQAAIRQIGTNSLSTLVQWLAYDPAPRRTKVAGTARHLPAPVRHSRLLRPFLVDQSEERANTAATALRVLGPAAGPAIPELTRLMNDTNSLLVSRRAIWVLARTGKEALLPLTAVLDNRQHPNRAFAVSCLADLGTNAAPAIPKLTQLLEDPDRAVRARATNTLRILAPEVLTNAVPAQATLTERTL